MHYSSVCQFGGTLPISQLAPKREEARERDRQTRKNEVTAKMSEKEKQKKRGKKEENTRTKERVRQTQKSGRRNGLVSELQCSEISKRDFK